MHETITILLGGAPGTGKTAIRRRAPRYFRERIGETAAFGMDDLYTQIDPDWSHANSKWGEIACDNGLQLAKNFFHHNFNVVLVEGNGFYHKDVVKPFLKSLLPITRVHHFMLDAQLDVVEERVRKRGDLDRHPPDWLSLWLEMVRSNHAEWMQIIDTTDLTPEGALDEMYERIINHTGAIDQVIE